MIRGAMLTMSSKFLARLTWPIDFLLRKILSQGAKNTLFMKAVRWNHPALVDWSLRVGGRYQGANNTWLHAAKHGSARAMKWVIQRGDTVSSWYLERALRVAITSGYRNVIQLSIESGANLNGMECDNHASPLDLAEETGDEKIIQLLREHGALNAGKITGNQGDADNESQEAEDPDEPSDSMSAGWICMFMDAMPFNLEFEVNDLRFIEMLPRHCGFEVLMTEAAEKMLGVAPTHDYATLNVKISDMLQSLRNGASFECDQTFPAATLGVLWSWQLVLKHDWSWCAVSQNWWETIAVHDPTRQCVILPVQYFRKLAGETGEIGVRNENPAVQRPEDLLAEIQDGRLPVSPGSLRTFIY